MKTTAAAPARTTARPALHYAPAATWMNDPNGLVYYKGLYHLYYQNNPFDNVWGNMSWGHATSTDLLSWQEQPVAIACDAEEEIFSGSIVVDAENSSGFGRDGIVPLVAIYTSAFTDGSAHPGVQAQSLAYSLDEGTSWTKYAHNPVLSRGSANFRDPKVFRYTGGRGSYWVMAAVEAADHQVLLYRSDNLRDWSLLSEFGPANAVGGVWECPDLFPLAVDGDPANIKWVLIVNLNPGGVAGGSGGQYFVGDFDGVSFSADNIAAEGSGMRDYQWLDWGRDYYAAVSFSNLPAHRRLMIGWMNNWDYGNQVPAHPGRSLMSLPREVSLVTVDGQPRLSQRAAAEPAAAGPVYAAGPRTIAEGTQQLPAGAAGDVLLIEADFAPGSAAEFGLVVRQGAGEGTVVGYSVRDRELIVDRRTSGESGFSGLFASRETAPVPPGETVSLRIYLDRCSVEVFTADGLATITDQIFPQGSSRGVSLYAVGGSAELLSLRVTPLAG